MYRNVVHGIHVLSMSCQNTSTGSYRSHTVYNIVLDSTHDGAALLNYSTGRCKNFNHYMQRWVQK